MLTTDPLTKTFVVRSQSISVEEDGVQAVSPEPTKSTDLFYYYDGRMYHISRAGHLTPGQVLEEEETFRDIMESHKTEVSKLPERVEGAPFCPATIDAVAGECEDLRAQNASLRRALMRIQGSAAPDDDSPLARKIIQIKKEELLCLPN